MSYLNNNFSILINFGIFYKELNLLKEKTQVPRTAFIGYFLKKNKSKKNLDWSCTWDLNSFLDRQVLNAKFTVNTKKMYYINTLGPFTLFFFPRNFISFSLVFAHNSFPFSFSLYLVFTLFPWHKQTAVVAVSWN